MCFSSRSLSRTVRARGILTSGGDSPGMNAAIRAVTRTAPFNNINVIGIQRGYQGLIDKEFLKFTSSSVSNTIQRGGTILKTARCKDFMTPKGRKIAHENMVEAGIDALIVIGGNGSLTGAQLFAREFDMGSYGWRCSARTPCRRTGCPTGTSGTAAPAGCGTDRRRACSARSRG